MTLQELIKTKRKEKKLTKTELAQLSGVSIQTLVRIEHGHKPNIMTLYNVLKVLDIDIETVDF